ncbi:hypothetical protein IG631_10973 [Alternaria alternata]|nr:hypothetical protein IG631_10973 [Alternaria alternata]
MRTRGLAHFCNATTQQLMQTTTRHHCASELLTLSQRKGSRQTDRDGVQFPHCTRG